MRYLRLLVFGVGAALLPFLVVAFFTWARDGRAAGLVAMLGRGELCPGATLLGAQALGTSYGVPAPWRGVAWVVAIGTCWLALGIASSTYLVPYAAALGYESRVASASMVAFVMAVAASLVTVRIEGKV